jgi:Zn-dependent protease with chaperone function
MSWSLLVLCAAASAAIAFATSATVAVTLAAARRWLDDLAAAAQARVLLVAALMPLLACAGLMTAALAPSFGWISDHCMPNGHAHAHPHICAAHHVAALPAGTLLVLAAVFCTRLLLRGLRLGHAATVIARTRRSLARIASTDGETNTRVLPFDEPQAFVVGALNPTLFVTRGLLSNAHREHLAPVLSHERAHLQRRDPMRRLVASIALAFHLPGVAHWLERRLARAHEMAADAAAATALRSPERVASALVGLTRARRRGLAMAMAFGNTDIEARVATLLDSRPRRDRPGKASLLATIALFFALVAVSADAVHHGVEMVLGVLGG